MVQRSAVLGAPFHLPFHLPQAGLQIAAPVVPLPHAVPPSSELDVRVPVAFLPVRAAVVPLPAPPMLSAPCLPAAWPALATPAPVARPPSGELPLVAPALPRPPAVAPRPLHAVGTLRPAPVVRRPVGAHGRTRLDGVDPGERRGRDSAVASLAWRPARGYDPGGTSWLAPCTLLQSFPRRQRGLPAGPCSGRRYHASLSMSLLTGSVIERHAHSVCETGRAAAPTPPASRSAKCEAPLPERFGKGGLSTSGRD